MIRYAVKLICFASALTAGGLLALGTTVWETVVGSGVPATETRDIGNATEVVLTSVGDLTIVPGEVPSLRIRADDNVLPVIDTETNGRKLIIKTRSRTTVRAKTPIRYVLTLPRLDAITTLGSGTVSTRRFDTDDLRVKISGAGKVRLDNLTCHTLNLSISGAGSAHLSGVTDTLKARLSGAGGIDAKELKANSAEVRISGAGQASVWADSELTARVSGAGGVKYKGHPKVEQKISGAGRVRPID